MNTKDKLMSLCSSSCSLRSSTSIKELFIVQIQLLQFIAEQTNMIIGKA